jgi:hypothetical protein
MDDASRLGRGRGRGIAHGEEHRGDLRRPLTTPQELTAAGLQQPLGSNANVKGFNDSRGQPQYSNEMKTSQPQLVHSRPALQNPTDQNTHAQIALANQLVQSQNQQLSLPALQQHLVNQQQLANQQQHLANQHHLVNQIQTQLANQHHMANQQMVNQQLVSVAQYVNQQQQLLQAQQQQHSLSSQSPQLYSVGGIAASNIPLQQYMDPQKVLEYEELKKKQAQLERIKEEHYKQQLEQQQQMEQQQRLQYLRQAHQQKLHNQASAMNALEIEQKLASLQLQNPDAIYLQQSPQQPQHQFIQQQHIELQKQHQQLQQQQYHQQLQQQARLSVLSNHSGKLLP